MLKTPKSLQDSDKWMLAENIPDCDLFFFQIPATCFVEDISYKFVKPYKKFIAVFKKLEMSFYFGERDSYEVAEVILKALIKRPGFGDDLNRNIIKWSRRLIAFARKIAKQPMGKLTNRHLWQIWQEHDRIHTKLYTYGWIPVCVDMFHNNMTTKLKQYLYTITENKAAAESAFVALTTPTKKTIVAQEREDLIGIYQTHSKELKRYKRKSVSEKLQKSLIRHVKKWGHLGYIYAGNVDPFGPDHYLKELVDLANSKADIGKLVREENRALRQIRQKQAKLFRALEVSPLYKRLFRTAQDFALTKLFRRHAQLFTLLTIHKTLLPEIAKRLGLTRYQVQFMLKGEVRGALLNGKHNKRLLRKRLRKCVYYTERGLEEAWIGPKAKVWAKKLSKTSKLEVNEVLGQTANPGYARGRVKIIIRAKDMAKMNKGDILLSIATDPDIVPAMKKASAIVTEQGGITSHAAIVSRELGKPCIIGTKIATKVFKDGDMVEVDAEKGIIKKIKLK